MNVTRKRNLPDENATWPAKKPKIALYLEDSTPIRTIEVDNLPTDLSEDHCKLYLSGYFGRDGPVENVELVRKAENVNEFLAYVTFLVPEDAASVINNKSVPGFARITHCTFKAAEPSRQPKIDPNAITLEQLNEHCLMYIMSQLKLIDVVNLGRASTRLQSVSQMYYKKYADFSYGVITGKSSINEVDLPAVLEEIGSHICSIEWHGLEATHLDLLGRHCPNVTKIKLFEPMKNVSSVCLRRNKALFAKLKRLHIHSASLGDTSIKTMISGRKLKTLDVNQCRYIRGSFLNTLNRDKLKNIKIVNCLNMSDFSTAEWKNKLITFAYDKCCSYIKFLSSPPASLERLKELELDFSCFEGNVESLNFSALKRIKKFTITRKHPTSPLSIAINLNNVIKALSHLDSLESLKIEGLRIDDDTVECLKLIKNLKNLRMTKIVNAIKRNFYEEVRINLPNLHELAISFVEVEKVTGKLICAMIAGLPKLSFFSHSSMTWMLLDLILQAVLSERRPILNIGISEEIFDPHKKEIFDAASKGAIVLSKND